jgi:hypothetical protein
MSEEIVGKAIAWGSMSRWPLVLLGTLAVVSPAKGQTALSASSLRLFGRLPPCTPSRQ